MDESEIRILETYPINVDFLATQNSFRNDITSKNIVTPFVEQIKVDLLQLLHKIQKKVT